MRILLTMQWGCVDYDNIKTVNGKVYASLHIEDSDLKELCLIEIEKLPNSNGRSLKDYTSLPCPDSSNLISIGIASLLLPSGRTTHSTFSIPLLMTEESTRNIAQGSLHANLLIGTKLII
ncbi:hypothetical protein GmHk_04G010701 [Glycine max]|nr:hypothetical protein GmHk_04G010701 [Glycine max]